MQSEEGPGYAAGEEETWTRTTAGIRTAGATATGPEEGGAPAGVLPAAILVGGPTGHRQNEFGSAGGPYASEAAMQDVEPHTGLGSNARGDDISGSTAAAKPMEIPGAVGQKPHWPDHGLPDAFTSAGRHVLYCGADIPMETLEHGQWHHSPRPKGCSPIQAAGSPQLMHATGHGWGHGHGHGLGPRHSDSGAGHYLSAPHMLLPPRTRSQQHGEAGGGGGGGVGGYGGAAGSTAAGMAGVPWVFRGGEAGRSGAGQEGKRQLQADEDMGMVEDDVVEVEADTPGGYHVSATVLHPADARDPEELIVAATAVLPPPHAQQQ